MLQKDNFHTSDSFETSKYKNLPVLKKKYLVIALGSVRRKSTFYSLFGSPCISHSLDFTWKILYKYKFLIFPNLCYIGVEQNRNQNFLSEDYWKYWLPVTTVRKNIFFLFIRSESLKWRWKWKDVLPAFFLTVVTRVPVFPIVFKLKQKFDSCTKVRFWFCPTPNYTCGILQKAHQVCLEQSSSTCGDLVDEDCQPQGLEMWSDEVNIWQWWWW